MWPLFALIRAWMRLGMLKIISSISAPVIASHSSWMATFIVFIVVGLLRQRLIRFLILAQMFFMKLKSGDEAGQSIKTIIFHSNQAIVVFVLWKKALSCITKQFGVFGRTVRLMKSWKSRSVNRMWAWYETALIFPQACLSHKTNSLFSLWQMEPQTIQWSKWVNLGCKQLGSNSSPGLQMQAVYYRFPVPSTVALSPSVSWSLWAVSKIFRTRLIQERDVQTVNHAPALLQIRAVSNEPTGDLLVQ